MTIGGETSVLINKNKTKAPTMIPKRLIKSMSVIFTALAERTRNMTDILKHRKYRFFKLNNIFLIHKTVMEYYLQVLSIKAPYARAKPISRSQILIVQVTIFGVG